MEFWACAYQYEEDVFYDFALNDIDYGIQSTQLLPTKELAEQLIKDMLCEDYVPVEIIIKSYRDNGCMSYSTGRVERWAYMNGEDEDIED